MKNELQKCLQCKTVPCHVCPANTDVTNVIALARLGKIHEAGQILFNNNPLSAITGLVCPNHLFCKGGCVLGIKGEPLDFGQIERAISLEYLDSPVVLDIERFPDKKALIVGSGPAGIAMAHYLSRYYHVTVYERESKFGGMLRYGIPDHRLDKTIIDKIVDIVRHNGVNFVANKDVDLFNLPASFDIIVLAIGAGLSKPLNIPGEEFAMGSLEYLKNPTTHEKVIVIGAGNVSIDVATTAKKLGGDVTLCYRRERDKMRAYPQEIKHAEDMGVKFRFNMVPKEINQDTILFDNGVVMSFDKLIIAIGQESQKYPENVYAVGDMVTGTKTIVQAVASAKKLAKQIKKSL